jgi:hypothetical protein
MGSLLVYFLKFSGNSFSFEIIQSGRTEGVFLLCNHGLGTQGGGQMVTYKISTNI